MRVARGARAGWRACVGAPWSSRATRASCRHGEGTRLDGSASLLRGNAISWKWLPWMLEAAIVLELVPGKYVEAAIIALLLVFNAALDLFICSGTVLAPGSL